MTAAARHPRRSEARAAGTAVRPSVCFITQNESFGGMEVHTLGVMRAFIDRGYAIELIANRYRRYDEIIQQYGWQDRVRIINTDLSGILYGERSDRPGWRRLFGEIASSILVFPKGNHSYGQIGFLRECRRRFKRIVFIEHLEAQPRPRATRRRFGVPLGFGLWWYKRRFLSQAGSRYADAIVAVSAAVNSRLVGDIGYPARKLTIVRNGVPWREFQHNAAHRDAVRRQHGIPRDAFVFGMLTRLSHEKGIDTALDALARLQASQPLRPFCLMIAGEGYDADRLKALAERLGVQEQAKFIGFVSRPEEVVSAYDVILFSSRVEGLPLGLLQGMAAGCAPIVTRISGMPEAVDTPDVGWVVTPDDPAALCSAMQEALSLDARAFQAKRNNAARRVREHFDSAEANRSIVELCLLPH
jgi:glycosyltransferase involved in cell wall biosynthesis